MSGRAKVFQLFASEDVDSDKVDFGMTVLASLRSAHFDDLARPALDDDEAVLTEGRTLHRIRS